MSKNTGVDTGRRRICEAPQADGPQPITLGADRGYDAADVVNELWSMNVRPHVAQNLTRSRGRSAIDGCTTPAIPVMPRASGSASRMEEGFGWMDLDKAAKRDRDAFNKGLVERKSDKSTY